MHYYISKLKQDEEYLISHISHLKHEIWHTQDKGVEKLLLLELAHTESILRRTRKTMLEMEKL